MTNDLLFVWRAEFDDDTVLDQFEEEVENSFKLVEDNMESLVRFSIVSVEDPEEVYTADLITGVIGGNGVEETVDGEEFSLVYHRRNEVRSEVGTNKIIESRKTHVLGLRSDVGEKTIEVFQPVGVLNKRVSVRNVKANEVLDRTANLVRNKPEHAGSVRDFDKLPSQARIRE